MTSDNNVNFLVSSEPDAKDIRDPRNQRVRLWACDEDNDLAIFRLSRPATLDVEKISVGFDILSCFPESTPGSPLHILCIVYCTRNVAFRHTEYPPPSDENVLQVRAQACERGGKDSEDPKTSYEHMRRIYKVTSDLYHDVATKEALLNESVRPSHSLTMVFITDIVIRILPSKTCSGMLPVLLPLAGFAWKTTNHQRSKGRSPTA